MTGLTKLNILKRKNTHTHIPQNNVTGREVLRRKSGGNGREWGWLVVVWVHMSKASRIKAMQRTACEKTLRQGQKRWESSMAGAVQGTSESSSGPRVEG